ncbi:rhophilin-1 isoform X1 [Homo sapiens]|uniref:rhophilin-1 isoform X1 n=3 Tax=Homo sapiens TaxID=9606 RepID=UPI0000055852|nr:rhophilin-1 isoform X1 [Homo sapiens]XP_054215676.1 rhophilin-1 isoform X1 [Homo sapiens]|eukprot:XP_005250829.1 rhophilin-1 isoform X3 [Homo sapiens]
MILEERPDGAGAGEESPRLQISRRKPRKTRVSSLRGRREGLRDVCAWRGCRVHRGEDPVRVHVGPMNPQLHAVGCDSLTQIQCGQLQSRRAQIHQQIDKELQMRTGAENLYRATSNNRVRETVALELSYVNSNLQLLKEELEELSGGVDPGRHGSEAVTVPMIPLGLKETKELDWSTPLKELISVHFGEDGASYEAEIRELEALRQAMRTPSRNESGLELLTAYYNQLCFLDARFLTPARSLGLFFHWYDSLTGVPAQQRALAFEKGSVLFNIGALHTQIGARQDRSCTEGARRAMEAFQRAAGAFSLLRENFSHAPSPDMSAASLCALEQLMMAQAQECVFEGLSPPASMAPQDCLAQLRLAQEAAQVAAEYRLVHRTMAQPPVHDYVPVSWTALVHVKAEYFRSLAHYHVAMALCDGSPATEGELPTHEQVFLQPPTSSKPRGPVLPQELEERRQLGKAHLKRAILGQEEALRLHALCRVLREVDLLRAVISQTLQRSLAKYAELDREDDFCEAAEAPDIQPKTHQKPEARMPRLSQGKGPDIFHRLGPLSVFSAKNRWRLVGPVHLTRGEGGFGLTLRGDSPVLIAAVIPGSQAAAAGLKEGDYIVSVNGQPCRWWRHAEVVTELKAAGEAGASLQVVSLLPSSRLPSLGDRRPVLLGPRGLLRSQREHGCKTPASTWASPRPLLNWSRKAQQGKTGGCPQPCAPVKPAPPSSLKHPGWP